MQVFPAKIPATMLLQFPDINLVPLDINGDFSVFFAMRASECERGLSVFRINGEILKKHATAAWTIRQPHISALAYVLAVFS